jgi:hypothetical protein
LSCTQEKQQIEPKLERAPQSDTDIIPKKQAETEEPPQSVPREDHDYEAGFGGQEDLEDRYATTSGEH